MTGAVSGWLYQPLDQVAEVEYGTRVVRKNDAGVDYPVYGGGGATFYVDRYNREDCTIVARFGMSEDCVRFVGGRFFLNDSGLSVRTRIPGVLTQRFLDVQLLARQGEIYSLGRGAAQKNLDVSAFRALTVAVPPLEEQQRIVAILDEAFEGLTRARANAEANLVNARELFDAKLTRLFSSPPSTWIPASLGSKCSRITVGHVGPMARRYSLTGIPFLRSQNVRPFQIDLTDVKYIDETFMSELRKSELRPGDVAIVRTGYPGTAAVIPSDLPLANCADLVIARTGPDLSPHFLAMLLNSSFGKAHVAHVSVGAAQQHFNVGAAKASMFPLPPLNVQIELAAEAADFREETALLTQRYTCNLSGLGDLRQSLLRKAFAGELA